jgi:hypothetical protein
MYSEITKVYDKKTVGHVFTKPLQIEQTTQFFFPESCFYPSSYFCRWVSVQAEIKWTPIYR